MILYVYYMFTFIYFVRLIQIQTVMDQAKGGIRTIATAEDPSLVRCFRGHEKGVTSVQFARQMKQVVSGGCDGLVEVWNFKPQIRPFKFVGHKGPVHDVLFNGNSTLIYSCGEDRQIKIWKNSVNGKNKSVKAHSGPVLKLSLSHDEQFLVSCSSDKTMKLWSSEGKFRQSFLGHTNWVRQCQISPDQRLLLSCSDDKTVKVWDIQKATTLVNFLEHKSEVYTAKFTPDGTCIAAGANDGTIKMWDTRINKLIQHYNGHDQTVNRLVFHPLGYHMASTSNDNKIKIWDLKYGRLGWTLFGHQGEIKTIDFNEKGDYFATGGEDKLVMIWMSNFDRDMNGNQGFKVEKGRTVQVNFREKSSGEGLQPLFRSNKLGNEQGNIHYNDQSEEYDQKLEKGKHTVIGKKKESSLGELLSFELQKIVNQLQIVTRSLDFMDKNVSEHEKILDKISQHELAEEIINEMEGKGLMKEEIYNSAWEAENKLHPKLQFVIPSENIFADNEDQPNQQDKYNQFLREQEQRKNIFRKKINQDQIDFNALELQNNFD